MPTYTLVSASCSHERACYEKTQPEVFFRWQNGSTTESSHQALSHATARRAQTFRKLPGSSRRARGSDVSPPAFSESTRLTARQRQRQRQRRQSSIAGATRMIRRGSTSCTSGR